jgi:flavin-dependent dehydrogenase
MSTEFDIAILGAGPAGAATARQLAQSGCRVVLLERSQFETPRVGESLAPATQPLLVELGVWLEFMALLPLPSYGTRSIWGSADAQDHSHLMSPYGCGWHVDRLAFDRMLAQAAVTAGAELRCGSAIVHCEVMNDGRWLLRCNERGSRNSTALRARVLIDATGRGAHLARRLGAQRIIFDRLVGIAALFSGVDVSSEGFILVETSSEGWWYSAPVPPDRMITMLMTDSDLCGRSRLSVHRRWRELAASAPTTFARVPQTMLWGGRLFSAISQRLHRSELAAPWIAIGDAALAVDPISGSGVVRALRSARAGTEAALALLNGRSPDTIKEYEARCDLECTVYLHERAMYYGIERRWQSPFWRRRVTILAQTGSAAPVQELDRLHARARKAGILSL